jgi:predicted Zn-dependent protease
LLLSFSSAQDVSPSTPASVFDRLAHAPLSDNQKEELGRLLRAHEYESAETKLVAWIARNPNTPELLTLAASVFFLDKKPLNSAIALKKADNLHALNSADRFLLALAYIGMDRGDWARPELNRLTAAEPKNQLYPYWLARLDYSRRQYDDCATRLRNVTRADPTFMKAWDNLGLCYEGAGKLDDAIASYREANRLNDSQGLRSPWPPLNLGSLLLRTEKLNEAAPLLKKAIDYDGTSSQAHYRLGLILEKQGNEEAAIPELKRSAELDPKYPDPLYALARLYRRQGKMAEAAQAFEAFQKLKKAQRG